MLFVTLGQVRAATARERIARRMKWSYPERARVIAEYWLQIPDPQIIVINESDSIVPIMAATSAWEDVFSLTVVPAAAARSA